MESLNYQDLVKKGLDVESIYNQIELETGMDCDWDETDKLSQAGYEYGYYFGTYIDDAGEIYEAMLSEPDEIRFIKR